VRAGAIVYRIEREAHLDGDPHFGPRRPARRVDSPFRPMTNLGSRPAIPSPIEAVDRARITWRARRLVRLAD
jgi:hypothetical protein